MGVENSVSAKSARFQEEMALHGIAWHNVITDECAVDFCCCQGDGKYNRHFPSYYESAKQLFDELYERIKHGDEEHQRWLKNEMDKFLNEEVKP